MTPITIQSKSKEIMKNQGLGRWFLPLFIFLWWLLINAVIALLIALFIWIF